MILTLPLVSSYTSPLTFDNSSRASPSSSIPLIRIEKVFIAEPTLSAFCTISWPPVKIAIVSSKLAPVEAIAEAERSRPSIISSLLVANALPTELIFDIIPSLTSSTWTSKAFIVDTNPVVALSISIPGEIVANCELSFAISVALFLSE